MTDNGGWVEPIKRRARTEREVGPGVDGGPKVVNGAEIGRRVRRGPGGKPLPESLTFFSLSWHIPVDMHIWWGGCREEFRLRVEIGRKKYFGNVRHAHILVTNVHRKVKGIFIPHYNALSSLLYKRTEGSLVKGLPILRVKGIPLRSRVISSRVLSCFPLLYLSSISPFAVFP